MSSIIKPFNFLLFIILLFFNSCCSIPFVDCGPIINRITLQNDSVFFDASQNKLIKFELFEYKLRQSNKRYYNLNLDVFMDYKDSLDLSSVEISLLNSKDTIATKKHLILKDKVFENYRNSMYSFNFDNVLNENYDFIILNNIKVFNKEKNKWTDYNHILKIIN